jgi:cytochrome oxidase assembly protein ShyY1
MELGKAAPLAPGAIVQNIDPARAAAATGLLLNTFFLQQSGPDQPDAVDDMLLRVWPSPSSGIDKHRGYAFQWYALAAMAVLFFVITGFRSGSKQGDARKREAATSDAAGD